MPCVKRVIQFTHPGPEHTIKPGKCDLSTNIQGTFIKTWNKNKQHARKYIRTKAVFIDKFNNINDYSKKVGKVDFWGEWEPESVAEKLNYELRNEYTSQYPDFVHYPFYSDWKNYDRNILSKLQNTDPFVFDKRFYYTCCKQKFTDNLDFGSVILFGTSPELKSIKVDGRTRKQYYGKFIIDTVFVVKNIIKADKIVIENFNNPDNHIFYNCVLHKIHYGQGSENKDNIKHIIFEGATIDNPYNGMFSFFPCKPSDSIGRKRLEIDESLYANISTVVNSMPKVVIDCGSDSEIAGFWNALVNHTIRENYCLGVSTNDPPYFNDISSVQNKPSLVTDYY